MANPRWICRNGTVSDLHVGVVVHTHQSIDGLYSADPHLESNPRSDHSRWLCIAVKEDENEYAFIWLEDSKPFNPTRSSPTPKQGWLKADDLNSRMKSDNVRIEEPA